MRQGQVIDYDDEDYDYPLLLKKAQIIHSSNSHTINQAKVTKLPPFILTNLKLLLLSNQIFTFKLFFYCIFFLALLCNF